MREMDGYDVVVVGGGTGGVAAAIAAGRGGAKTLLIEREGCLGGGATTMLVHPFMGYRTHGPAKRIANAGLFAELIRRLQARGEASEGDGRQFNDEAMKVALDEMVAEAGVDVLFHAALFDAEVDDGRVTAVRLAHNGGPIRVAAPVFVDGTGDGLLAERAGCEIEIGDEQGNVMPMTLNFALGGVDRERFTQGQQEKSLRERCRDGDQDEPALINTHFSCTSFTPDGLLHLNQVRTPGNTLDAMDLSRAEIEGRRRVQNFIAWARANVPGLVRCWLAKTGSHVGIRESRRVMGDYVLTLDDFQAAAKFDDAIACCTYPVDKHNQAANDTTFYHLEGDEYYQIPYRCLRPRGRTNLLMACRAVSADVYVHASLRVMAPVMNIGEAAGLAAAMSLPAGDVRAIDTADLQRRIREGGGLLAPA